MTREEAKELLPIIKAYAEGKTIQIFDDRNEWNDLNKPTFDGDPSSYRIKPEPKYRPFKTQEECWNEMHKHPDFGWVRDKLLKSYYPMEKVSISVNYSSIFEEYEFTDGEPFGIKEE